MKHQPWQLVNTGTTRRIQMREIRGTTYVREYDSASNMSTASLPGIDIATALVAFAGPDATLVEPPQPLTDKMKRRYARQPRQAPFGCWQAAHRADRGDRWVESALGKYLREMGV